VIGSGPIDVVFPPAWFNNFEMQWDDARLAPFPTRLAPFGRLIMLNMRGMGLSDPIPHTEPPTVEREMDDISAVPLRSISTPEECGGWNSTNWMA
jgi:pimeloyl-ACP methyl ester carboxylesterase